MTDKLAGFRPSEEEAPRAVCFCPRCHRLGSHEIVSDSVVLDKETKKIARIVQHMECEHCGETCDVPTAVVNEMSEAEPEAFVDT